MAVRRRPVTDRRREAEFVAVDLCVGRGKEVDAEAVGELDEVERDVGDLVEDVLRQLGIVAPGPRLLRSEPLEERDQLADFAGKRHHEILRGMPLLPLADGGEVAEALGQLLEGHGRGYPGHHRAQAAVWRKYVDR